MRPIYAKNLTHDGTGTYKPQEKSYKTTTFAFHSIPVPYIMLVFSLLVSDEKSRRCRQPLKILFYTSLSVTVGGGRPPYVEDNTGSVSRPPFGGGENSFGKPGGDSVARPPYGGEWNYGGGDSKPATARPPFSGSGKDDDSWFGGAKGNVSRD